MIKAAIYLGKIAGFLLEGASNGHYSDHSRSSKVPKAVALKGLLAGYPKENPLHPNWQKRKDPPK